MLIVSTKLLIRQYYHKNPLQTRVNPKPQTCNITCMNSVTDGADFGLIDVSQKLKTTLLRTRNHTTTQLIWQCLRLDIDQTEKNIEWQYPF